LSKVFQGILSIEYDFLNNKETLVSLWAHEAQRIFYDRLVDEKDRSWFLNVIQGYLQNNFQIEWDINYIKEIVFGDFANSQSKYMKIDDLDSLPKKLTDFMLKHNSEYPGKAMNLVFFKDAILHLSKIGRILKQNRGNALLIGVGGSGRQSLTRLAASIRDYKIFTIEIAKNYKDPQWKDDLKSLIKTAGKNEPVTFLFSDTQIVKESFLEDLNNILNTG
jgi:dynein heavy chain